VLCEKVIQKLKVYIDPCTLHIYQSLTHTHTHTHTHYTPASLCCGSHTAAAGT